LSLGHFLARFILYLWAAPFSLFRSPPLIASPSNLKLANLPPGVWFLLVAFWRHSACLPPPHFHFLARPRHGFPFLPHYFPVPPTGGLPEPKAPPPPPDEIFFSYIEAPSFKVPSPSPPLSVPDGKPSRLNNFPFPKGVHPPLFAALTPINAFLISDHRHFDSTEVPLP